LRDRVSIGGSHPDKCATGRPMRAPLPR
jgi:hypothetical protein